MRSRQSNLFFAYARILCRGRDAHVICCVPVYGVKKGVLVLFGPCLVHPLYCMVTHITRVWINRVRLPILLLVS